MRPPVKACVVEIGKPQRVASITVAAAAIYSNNNDYSHYDPYQNVAGLESGVQNPELAADLNLNNFATINTFIGMASNVTLRLGFDGTGAAGDRAGMVVGNVSTSNTLLNLNAAGIITLTMFNGVQQQETWVVSAELARAILLGGDRPTQLEFVTKTAFTAVELSVGGLATA